ncbi:hypothetical protein J4232_01595, partial [Candidatus Woesearchaeota archaeon]|nr:hypothetical protein [Candidatus Woesearchaeota archaeon]
DLFKDHMDDAVSRLREKDINHTNRATLTKNMLFSCAFGSFKIRSSLYCLGYWYKYNEFDDEIKMSVDLLENYYYLALNTSHEQPGRNVSFINFTLIDGNGVTPIVKNFNPYDDGLNDDFVPINDGDNVFGNISSQNKVHYRIKEAHSDVIKAPIVHQMILNRINNLPEKEEKVYKIG